MNMRIARRKKAKNQMMSDIIYKMGMGLPRGEKIIVKVISDVLAGITIRKNKKLKYFEVMAPYGSSLITKILRCHSGADQI